MKPEFNHLKEEYIERLHTFILALKREIRTHILAQGALSPDEIRRRIETHLERAISQWVTDLLEQAYTIEIKQAARQALREHVVDEEEQYPYETALDRRIEQRLVSLSFGGEEKPDIHISSPYLKPAGVLTLTSVTTVSLSLITQGFLQFLGPSVVIISGGYVAWRIFQSELLQIPDEVETQAHSFINRFCQRAEQYFQDAAHAIEEETEVYIRDIISSV